MKEDGYLLRTNITGRVADRWRSDIPLTEAEPAFRIQKDDRRIRPIWHQKEDRVAAPLLVCFRADVRWKTLAPICPAAGLGREPRKVLDELAAIKLGAVLRPTKGGVDRRRRCLAQPTPAQAILLDRLTLRLPTALATPHASCRNHLTRPSDLPPIGPQRSKRGHVERVPPNLAVMDRSTFTKLRKLG